MELHRFCWAWPHNNQAAAPSCRLRQCFAAQQEWPKSTNNMAQGLKPCLLFVSFTYFVHLFVVHKEKNGHLLGCKNHQKSLDRSTTHRRTDGKTPATSYLRCSAAPVSGERPRCSATAALRHRPTCKSYAPHRWWDCAYGDRFGICLFLPRNCTHCMTKNKSINCRWVSISLIYRYGSISIHGDLAGFIPNMHCKMI